MEERSSKQQSLACETICSFPVISLRAPQVSYASDDFFPRYTTTGNSDAEVRAHGQRDPQNGVKQVPPDEGLISDELNRVLARVTHAPVVGEPGAAFRA